jgi:hypothetical protein
MIHIGLDINIVNWIKDCYNFVSYGILTNGVASQLFHPHKGLRTGFPLSPLLFLLVANGLSNIKNGTKAKGPFKGIQIARGLNIDEILLFSNGPFREAKDKTWRTRHIEHNYKYDDQPK